MSAARPHRPRLSAAALALAASLALAVEPARVVPCLVEARGDRLVATVDLGDAFPADLQKQLSNGLTNVVALHVGLVPERGDEPVALFGREIDVLYDVWDETYLVTVKDPATPRGRVAVFDDFHALRGFLGQARGLDLGPVAALRDRAWVVQTRVELNPVSRELLERTREFIAHPATARGGAPSRSVLGAMASYLLKGAEAGADAQLLRSPVFTAREVARP